MYNGYIGFCALPGEASATPYARVLPRALAQPEGLCALIWWQVVVLALREQ